MLLTLKVSTINLHPSICLLPECRGVLAGERIGGGEDEGGGKGEKEQEEGERRKVEEEEEGAMNI